MKRQKAHPASVPPTPDIIIALKSWAGKSRYVPVIWRVESRSCLLCCYYHEGTRGKVDDTFCIGILVKRPLQTFA